MQGYQERHVYFFTNHHKNTVAYIQNHKSSLSHPLFYQSRSTQGITHKKPLSIINILYKIAQSQKSKFLSSIPRSRLRDGSGTAWSSVSPKVGPKYRLGLPNVVVGNASVGLPPVSRQSPIYVIEGSFDTGAAPVITGSMFLPAYPPITYVPVGTETGAIPSNRH